MLQSSSKLELLSPAKNAEYGKAAINAGADAVYIGAPRFGARAAAANSVLDIEQLCRYAHAYHARVYVALNTLLYDNELDEAQRLIKQLYEAGADALIVQDMGILQLDLPPIALHASTQTNNYDPERIAFLDQCGFSRIVLARELSLAQIRNIRSRVKADLEFFVYGALCVSLSGQCYISQATTERSANRGECSQPCRLAYDVLDAEGNMLAHQKHVLSLKDLNLSESIPKLIDAGIRSFKIEGRLKDLAYVKNTTAYFRKQIDTFLNQNPAFDKASSGSVTFDFEPDPSKTFSRSETSYFINERQTGIASFETPKSTGKQVGTLLRSQNDSLEVNLTQPVIPGDGLCFYQQGQLTGFLVNRVENQRIWPQKPIHVDKKTPLFRNYDKAFLQLMDTECTHRKIKVDLCLSETEQGFVLTATDEDGLSEQVEIHVPKTVAEKPEKAETAIMTQLSKSGGTLFEIGNISIVASQAYFIQASVLNALRRELLIKLEEKRIANLPREEAFEKVSSVRYPYPRMGYELNVANRLSRLFYEQAGVADIKPAFELAKPKEGDVLMTTRHCIRYELELCPTYQKPNKQPRTPWLLRDKNRSYRLHFDCKSCLMHVEYLVKK